MELLERDGKFFMQLLNGELEITEAQASAMVAQRGATIRNNLKSWIDSFSHHEWPLTAIPNSAAAFFQADQFFNDIILELEHIYHDHQNERTATEMVAFCQGKIDEIRNGAYAARHHEFSKYGIACWGRVAAFVHGMSGY